MNATPDTGDQRLIQNAGSASNLAIRLQEPGSHIILKPNDPTSTLTQIPGGAMDAEFRLEATVLRVGGSAPTPGTIDAVAKIVLSIL